MKNSQVRESKNIILQQPKIFRHKVSHAIRQVLRKVAKVMVVGLLIFRTTKQINIYKEKDCQQSNTLATVFSDLDWDTSEQI